jgi:short-subunit dehydrogenase
MATYAATKAFEAHLVEALAAELPGTGVRATAVLPGPTRTEFRVAGDASGPPRGVPKDDPETVVRAAWVALDRGRPRASVGRVARLGAVGGRLLPRRAVTRLVARWGRPRTSPRGAGAPPD